MHFEEYRRHDATGLAALVEKGEVTAAELLELAAGRAREVEHQINAISVSHLEHAEQALAGGLPQGPFHGVPFLLKDLYAFLAGTRLTNGSRLLDSFVCPADNTYVTRCKAAGLVIFGKTNSPEFGLNVTTEPVAHGPTRNPWDRGRSAGGSSGGAAAAVAAGIVPMAHATDGGGSIRIPAAACGLVGLKPSRARNPVGPLIGEAWNGLATGHVISRSVRDTARMLDATSGPEPGDPYACPPPERPFASEPGRAPGQLRIALLHEAPSGVPVAPESRAAVEGAAQLCADLGHQVEEGVPALAGAELRAAMETIVAVNFCHDLDFWQQTLRRRAEPGTVERCTLALAACGREIGGRDLLRAIQACQRAGRALGGFFERHDILLSPTLAAPPPELGRFAQDQDDLDQFLADLNRHVPFTPLYNLTGCPAVSLPLHWSPAGLPIGVMFGARLGGEGLLLRLAAQLEEARPWRGRLAPV